MTRGAFENAIRVCHAIGGSTNVVVHLTAVAGRLGPDYRSTSWTGYRARRRCCSQLRPTGKFQMEQLFEAGGMPAVMKELAAPAQPRLPHRDRRDARRQPGDVPPTSRVIAPLAQPFALEGGLAVLRGNLAPHGAVIKHAAARTTCCNTAAGQSCSAPLADLSAAIDDPDLGAKADDVLVLQNAGPVGRAGHAGGADDPDPGSCCTRGSATWCASRTAG